MSQSTVLQLYEFGEAHLLPASVKPEALKKYLRQVWQNRHWLYHYSEEETVRMEQGQPFLQFDGAFIQARNYAGVIHFQGVSIYLVPKLFKNAAVGVAEMVAHLSFYLSYCRHVQFPFHWHPTETVPSDMLRNWIHYFASFASALLNEQPYQTYQTHTGETDYVRGKLAVQPYIQEQLSRGQWQRLQTEQQPFVLNNLFNQVVKYTASQLYTIADKQTQTLVQDVLSLLAEVELRQCSPLDCEAVHLSRLYPKHQEVLDMCRFFLAGAATGGLPDNTMNFAFLIPMERVFEDFVAGFIQNHFPEWQAEFQKPMPLAVSSANRTLQARPDLWLPYHRMLWDTKYKLLATHEFRHTIPAADLYQMFAYAAAYNVEAVHLLYASAGIAAHETIRFTPESASVCVHVHSLPIVLSHPDDTFSALTLRLKETFQKIATL